MTSTPARAATCPECVALANQLQSHLASLQAQQDLLKRNRDYLATIKSDDLSKAVKIRSNILILEVRSETLKNHAELARKSINEGDCRKCVKGKP